MSPKKEKEKKIIMKGIGYACEWSNKIIVARIMCCKKFFFTADARIIGRKVYRIKIITSLINEKENEAFDVI